MHNYLAIALFFVWNTSLAQEKMSANQYIDTYKDIAIAEMQRTGIPASITLAQGLIESGNGNSSLSRQSNNHFGIKCKKDWAGKSVNYDDDAPQECFRAYDRAEDSYRDHSDFLRSGKRYAFLFVLEPTDYKGWARGLKEAGYATNPQYADMLISAIEKYSLFQYDIGNQRQPLPPDGKPGKEPLFTNNGDREITSFNGILAYEVKAGETYAAITEQNYMMRWEIAKYNDLGDDEELEAGTILYLKPKFRKAREQYHVVKPGEGMYYISQLHAIKLSSLYKLNLMKKGEEPAAGETLNLRKKRETVPWLSGSPVKRKALKRMEPPKKEQQVIMPVIEETKENIPVTPIPDPLVNKTEEPAQNIAADNKVIHTVQSGETLYSISKKYKVTVEGLQTRNNLTTNSLSLGQKLIIP